MPNETYLVCKVNTNRTQTLHRIRLRKFATDATLEGNYDNEKFRPDDAIYNSQDDLYSMVWEPEYNPSPLDCPTVYRDPATTEYAIGGNSVTRESNRESNDESSSQKYNHSSDFVNDEPHSNKQLIQDHVNVPKTGLRDDNDAPTECDGTSKP